MSLRAGFKHAEALNCARPKRPHSIVCMLCTAKLHLTYGNPNKVSKACEIFKEWFDSLVDFHG